MLNYFDIFMPSHVKLYDPASYAKAIKAGNSTYDLVNGEAIEDGGQHESYLVRGRINFNKNMPHYATRGDPMKTLLLGRITFSPALS